MHETQLVKNKTFDEIAIGDSAELKRTLSRDDIELFAVMSGDVNPAHLDDEYARTDPFKKVIAHGMWGGSLISALLGTKLPGPGTIYLNQSLSFRRPVSIGDELTVSVTVTAKDEEKKRVTLECLCSNQDGQPVIKGEAEVIAPTEKVVRPKVTLPKVQMNKPGEGHERLIAKTADIPPVRTAVVHPSAPVALQGALEAAERGLITPILVGPKGKIEKAAEDLGADISALEIVDAPHSHAAAEVAVGLVRDGSAFAIMKGHLHTDELMGAVLNKTNGIRTERRMSHVYCLDVPNYERPLLITDAAINIYPNLEDKRSIVQNAIDLAHALGVESPRVAILSAVETVSPKITSTLDAAALCKMADRGQITGGRLDGPLAFDNAVSRVAADTKGIHSEVAGEADILVAPDLEAGNMLAKQLIYLAGAEASGVVLGARVPIMLTSRADSLQVRVASAALVQLYSAHHRGAVHD